VRAVAGRLASRCLCQIAKGLLLCNGLVDCITQPKFGLEAPGHDQVRHIAKPSLKESVMKSLWGYIEAHHKEYGVALFIVPVLVVVLIVISGFCAGSALFAT
jgi:hypothetical protein